MSVKRPQAHVTDDDPKAVSSDFHAPETQPNGEAARGAPPATTAQPVPIVGATLLRPSGADAGREAADADLDDGSDAAGHGDGVFLGATHTDSVAVNSLSDVLSQARPDDHAVSDGGQERKPIEIDTPDGPVQLHVTPKAPTAGTTVELEVVALAPGDVGAEPDQEGPHDGALVALDRAEQALESIVSVEDVLVALDRIEAMRAVLRRVDRTHTVANRCAALRLRAQRRGGQFLLETVRAKGGGDHRSPTVTGAPTLTDLGVKKRQSQQWRALATIAWDAFELFIKDALRSGDELSTAAVLAAHDSNGRPRKLKRPKSAPAKARNAKATPVAAPNPPSRPTDDEPDAAQSEMVEERISLHVAEDDAAQDATVVHGAASSAEPRYDSTVPLPVRARRSIAVPDCDRAVRGVLRDLRDLGERALELDGDDIPRVLREVEALAAALSARMQAEREAESEPESLPDSGTFDEPGTKYGEVE